MFLKTIFMRLLEAQTANGVEGWPCGLSEGNLDLKGWTAWRHVKAYYILFKKLPILRDLERYLDVI